MTIYSGSSKVERAGIIRAAVVGGVDFSSTRGSNDGSSFAMELSEA
jgi:hypothetical protein